MSRLRWLGKIALLVGLVACIQWANTEPVIAAPCAASETNYYSEPEMLNEVGVKWVNCFQPYVVITGEQTDWFQTTMLECCDMNCPSYCNN